MAMQIEVELRGVIGSLVRPLIIIKGMKKVGRCNATNYFAHIGHAVRFESPVQAECCVQSRRSGTPTRALIFMHSADCTAKDVCSNARAAGTSRSSRASSLAYGMLERWFGRWFMNVSGTVDLGAV